VSCVTVRCNVLQYVAACCSVLQRVADIPACMQTQASKSER